jgi:tetratricopeptide (TPR) repeat protein
MTFSTRLALWLSVTCSSLVWAQAPSASQDKLRAAQASIDRGDGKRALPLVDSVLLDTTLTPQQRADALRAKGQALLQLKRPSEAKDVLREATRLAPKDEKAWLYCGLAHDAAGDAAGAVQAYEEGVKQLPTSVALLHELGMAQMQAGRPDAAAATLKQATLKAPEDGELFTDAAYAHTLSGQAKQAEELARHAIEKMPESADAHYNLGLALLGLKRNKEAEKAFLSALDNDDLHEPAMFQLGLLARRGGDLVKATNYFQQVLKADPKDVRAKAQLGMVLVQSGKDDVKAEQLLRQALQVGESAEAHARLAEVLHRQNRNDEAKAELKKALALRPTEAEWLKWQKTW